MELNYSGRNITISDRFREYVDEKITKVDQLATKIQRIDVKVVKETHARDQSTALSVELTVVGRGPAIRAEARGADKFAAFDVAFAKLLERLRKARDKRKVHRGNHAPVAVHQATSALPVVPTDKSLVEETLAAQAAAEAEEAEANAEYSPVVIRRKSFPAEVMSVDDAVDRMELVGHPFYLFVDEATGEHSVVYGRTQYQYGVITLDASLSDETESTTETRGYRDKAMATEG
ncbi:ribosome hibernation-promoting factor, HPF/YfiA family [Glutamicibacter soli]|uniref:Ribosome hibernation promoting factor n=1 Tax=Glutamicibacter soli TaxID=453836 RepID=A0A365YQC0_9MICC|nr:MULTISPECIES: ribosome-associated translation inhibitor RaiA [Micrococcaceae]ALD64360.1 30S ribosomal protein S30 [Arthrobacter sp. LS16]ALQ30373.1 30S ribosomal protein S30 [Arthrobacter sp. YC-RL1]KLI88326.1 30S ribosomal protein S30 [Arthrobacter sp. YC-RL1]RBM04223.1 ribosome-associated translation inhibitor RaiA [Glutamicibacter soli]RKS22502.1 ribosomal subunit interface protein [Arthrobacter sp. AG1021]